MSVTHNKVAAQSSFKVSLFGLLFDASEIHTPESETEEKNIFELKLPDCQKCTS